MARTSSFDMQIGYSQLVVFSPEVERAGHLWEDEHLEQGFAWSPGIVSLATPEHAEVCLVEVVVADRYEPSPDAISAVRVPFTLARAPLQMTSALLFEEVDLVAPGSYGLVFETAPGEGDWIVTDGEIEETAPYSYNMRLIFMPDAEPVFAILKTGGGVRSDVVLRTDAELA